MTNLVTLYPNQKNNISVLRSISLASQLDQFPLIPRGQLLMCCSVDFVLSEMHRNQMLQFVWGSGYFWHKLT